MLLFQITYIWLVRVYVTDSHYIYSACESVCYCFTLHHWACQSMYYCFPLQKLSVSECMLLFVITGIERVIVYVTVSHYRHWAWQSVCYCFTLHTFSFSECIVQFHFTWLQVLYLSECMLLFHITGIVLIRVYVIVSGSCAGQRHGAYKSWPVVKS